MLALAQRSIVASVLNQRDEEEMAKTAQAREDEFVRWYHKREELVKFVQLVYRKTHPRNYASDERRAIREHAAMLLEDLDLWPPEDMEV
jgi:transposase